VSWARTQSCPHILTTGVSLSKRIRRPLFPASVNTRFEVKNLESGEVEEVEQRDRLFDWVQALVANKPGEL
jgi:hypothetical protein